MFLIQKQSFLVNGKKKPYVAMKAGHKKALATLIMEGWLKNGPVIGWEAAGPTKNDATVAVRHDSLDVVVQERRPNTLS
jgi:hypothetical protein